MSSLNSIHILQLLREEESESKGTTQRAQEKKHRSGMNYLKLGDFKEALKCFEFDLHSAKEAGDRIREGHAYSNLGTVYCRLGDPPKAIDILNQALSIAEQVGNIHWKAKIYTNLGLCHYYLSDFKTAIEFQQEALTIHKQFGNKNSEGLSCTNLGLVYHSLGDFKAALEFHQQALTIAKQIGTKDLEEKACCNLGVTYDLLGDIKTAIDYHQQHLSLAKELGYKVAEGNANGNLGNAYHALGDFTDAAKYHHGALNIHKEVGDVLAYCNVGADYKTLGDLKTAIEYLQQGLTIAKQIGNKNSEGMAYELLGDVYHTRGDFKTAIEFRQQSLNFAQEAGNKPSEGEANGGLGLAYHALGDFNTAIKYHKKHLDIAEQVGDKKAEGNAYLNLGLAYYSLSNFDEAVMNHEAALSIAEKTGNKESEGKACSNLGSVYGSIGDFKKAEKYFQQDLSLAKEAGNKNAQASACLNLGVVHRSLGDSEKAIDFCKQALSIAKEVGNKKAEAQAYCNLGDAYEFVGESDKAEDFYQSSVRLFDEMRNLLQSNDEWKIGLRNQYESVYRQLWLVQLQLNKTDDALSTAERGRAQALMDLMESQYGVKSTQTVNDKEDICCISNFVSSMTIFLAESSNAVNFWVLRKGQPCQFLQTVISDSLESLTQKAYKQIGVFEKVMCENRSLDDQEESKEMSKRNPGAKQSTSVDGEPESDALKILSERIISPISHLLQLQDSEVVIVPDASLFLVPYAALMDQDSRPLSQTIQIRLAPTLTSLKLMAECHEEDHRTSGALLVGDPCVESVRLNGREVEQLPAAKQEVEMIGNILNITPLTGKHATKVEVLSRLNSAALIHIAAHGRPETGEIILSPNPGTSKRPKEKDFVLTMADVLNVKLRAKLVVLSCCHSGRGKIKAEGVVGLARAFLGAGARAVLASLWAIHDKATLEFMRYFYEHLVEGKSAGKALNQAMKQMQESDDFRKVRYWAAFVLIGDNVTLNFNQLR